MSETEWSVVCCDGRVTCNKLGADSETAVVRWGDKYRIIRVLDELPAVCLLWIFGCASPVVLMSRTGCDVTVSCKGLSVVVQCWVLRGERTIPPSGPRCLRCVPVDPERASSWSFVKPVDCVVVRRRRCHRVEYRGVFCRSPCVVPGCKVLIQGVDVLWNVVSVGDMCVVVCGSVEMLVHSSCLICVNLFYMCVCVLCVM